MTEEQPKKAAVTALPSVALAKQEGKMDKVYHLSIEHAGDKYIVRYANGRRGGTLTTGTRTKAPVDLLTAQAVYENVLSEKLRDRYQVTGHGGPLPMTIVKPNNNKTPVITPKVTFLPQLLIPLSEAAGEAMIEKVNGTWCAQEKKFGKRLMIHKRNGEVSATQKQGRACAMPTCVAEMVGKLHGDCTLDGELMGDVYWAFDLLWHEGQDWRGQAYGKRLATLEALIGNRKGSLRVVHTVRGVKDVRAHCTALRAANAEGMVFKDLCAAYVSGDGHRTQYKFKFYAECSCVVQAHNEARSVAVSLYFNDGSGQGICLGNVTIPPNHDVPPIGAVIEVRYLFAFKGGALYEPVYNGLRTDVPNTDCTLAKQNLKFKPQGEDE